VTKVGSAINIKQVIEKLYALLKDPDNANYQVEIEELLAFAQCWNKGKWKEVISKNGTGLFDLEAN
jgi:hypothetical protein